MANTKSYSSADPVTKYCATHSLRLHPLQQKLLDETLTLPMGRMIGAPEVVQFNCNLMRSIRAKRVLDIGVFTGFSAISAALALPDDGRVYACDITDKWFKEHGEKYAIEAKVQHKILMKVAPAADTLQGLISNGEKGTFDFAFIDADKDGYDTYYEKSLELLRPGGIIAFDNVLWSEKVLKEEIQDEDTKALRAIVRKVHKDTRVECSFLREGDGLMLAFKK